MERERIEAEDKNLWTEDVVGQKIVESAEEMPIPESLEPEQVKKRLKERQTKGRVTAIRRITEIAAAIAVVVAIGSVGAHYMGQGDGFRPGYVGSSSSGQNNPGDMEPENGGNSHSHSANAGDKYRKAEDYQAVYDSFRAIFDENNFGYWINGSVDDAAVPESPESSSWGRPIGAATVDGSSGAFGENTGDGNTNAAPDYSDTNLQTEGVDESDIVKTDGNYLYVAKGQKVSVIRLEAGKMKEAGQISPVLEAGDFICEMYVDGNRLCLILQNTQTALKTDDPGSVGFWNRLFSGKVYYTETEAYTRLQTYDITNPGDIRLLGTVSQEGYYNTSRKVGDYVYLFSENYPGYYKSFDAFLENGIPTVQGEKISADDIYIPDQACQMLVVTSVDVKQPNRTVDRIAVMHDNTQIYVGNENIYLYNSTWEQRGEYTEIASFSYKDGVMDAKAAGRIKGSVQDTFAIQEQDGCLRVLTTGWEDGGSNNRLYLLDESLKCTGEISGIAVGEQIYAARYLGDMAYFITYRNMDPLFVADLSDKSNPKLLGSVEVTGFSDYLHIYGENRIVGIGYETDEYSIREGVKLCMFDVSDSAQPKVVDFSVMPDAEYTPAAYGYKSVLINSGKNLIGFLTIGFPEGNYTGVYHIFRWEEDHFKEAFSLSLKEEEIAPENRVRGLYVGDYFYLVGTKTVQSFAMERDFEKTDELEYAR